MVKMVTSPLLGMLVCKYFLPVCSLHFHPLSILRAEVFTFKIGSSHYNSLDNPLRTWHFTGKGRQMANKEKILSIIYHEYNANQSHIQWEVTYNWPGWLKSHTETTPNTGEGDWITHLLLVESKMEQPLCKMFLKSLVCKDHITQKLHSWSLVPEKWKFIFIQKPIQKCL